MVIEREGGGEKNNKNMRKSGYEKSRDVRW